MFSPIVFMATFIVVVSASSILFVHDHNFSYCCLLAKSILSFWGRAQKKKEKKSFEEKISPNFCNRKKCCFRWGGSIRASICSVAWLENQPSMQPLPTSRQALYDAMNFNAMRHVRLLAVVIRKLLRSGNCVHMYI